MLLKRWDCGAGSGIRVLWKISALGFRRQRTQLAHTARWLSHAPCKPEQQRWPRKTYVSVLPFMLATFGLLQSRFCLHPAMYEINVRWTKTKSGYGKRKVDARLQQNQSTWGVNKKLQLNEVRFYFLSHNYHGTQNIIILQLNAEPSGHDFIKSDFRPLK